MADDPRHMPSPAPTPDARAAEARGSDRLPTRLVIGGERVDAVAGTTLPVINPATEEILAHVALAGAADIDRAVRNAREAFESAGWQGTSARQRGRMLLRLADAVVRG